MPIFAAKKYGMEKIFITTEQRRTLDKEYGQANVSKALNYSSNSLLSREIRQRALSEMNGVYFKKPPPAPPWGREAPSDSPLGER